MKALKATVMLSVLIFLCAAVHAQGDNGSGIAATMRSNGRIYVVVAVMTTILLGLFIYLVRLDRRISKIEKE